MENNGLHNVLGNSSNDLQPTINGQEEKRRTTGKKNKNNEHEKEKKTMNMKKKRGKEPFN